MPHSEHKSQLPNSAFNSAVSLLLIEAAKIVARASDLNEISPTEREKYLAPFLEHVASPEFQPPNNEQVDLTISQAKVTIENKLSEHTENAIYQALHIKRINDKYIDPLRTYQPESELSHHLNSMIMALMAANRHLAMIEALKNLQSKHYSIRAAKGGYYKRHQQPSQKRTSDLLSTMVKSILYRDPSFLNMDKFEAADQIAERIFQANTKFDIIDIDHKNIISNEVHNLLVELASKGKSGSNNLHPLSRLRYSLRLSLSQKDTEKVSRMDIEAARRQGRIEGVRVTLIQQLEQRFGKLSESDLAALESASDLDQLQTYLVRLAEAKSVDDVILNK